MAEAVLKNGTIKGEQHPLDKLAINTIRTLAMDAVQAAESGHPGGRMAAAGKWVAARFNKPGFDDLINFNGYAQCGDGCLMEGISSEAASLAGHLKLSTLCWIYDNNHITIEGNTALAFSDDVACRFLAYGWNVTRVGDANDLDLLARAYETFLHTRDRPTLIIVDSHIAYGAPHKHDTSAAH